MGRGSGCRRTEILCIDISKGTSNTQTAGLLFFHFCIQWQNQFKSQLTGLYKSFDASQHVCANSSSVRGRRATGKQLFLEGKIFMVGRHPLVTCVNRSVVSNPLRPHGLQPARLLCPQNFCRQEYWSGQPFPSPRNLPDPEIEPASPATQADSLLSEPPGKLVAGTIALPKCLVGACGNGRDTLMAIARQNLHISLERHQLSKQLLPCIQNQALHMGMEAENWERRNQKCLRNCPAFWELELGWKSGTWTVFSPLIVFLKITFFLHTLSIW